MVHQRLVELPELGKHELTKVLARKAVQACGEPAEAPYFSAAQQAPPGDGKPGRWLLAAMERGLARELALGLRRRGLRTRRVTSVALGALDRAASLREEPGEGALCVLVGRRSIQISLFCDEELLTVETLEGDLLEAPQLVASLLQSIKTTAGYWRRTRRGTRCATCASSACTPTAAAS
ncbi:MAG: hypothetical protein H6828_00465 [Planctomycetes bacterium]|nr:hypothetical protein [Planctomycetota bacterium]